tara:strand:- start:7104 stop:7247 length:144 start_codon:yes stop_codon:yes gene_type:complete
MKPLKTKMYEKYGFPVKKNYLAPVLLVLVPLLISSYVFISLAPLSIA